MSGFFWMIVTENPVSIGLSHKRFLFIYIPEKFRMLVKFRVPVMLQSFGFPHFLVLPFMMLTSFYLVVLSDSRFSIEGDKSKSNIFVFRFKAPAAAPRVSLEAVLNLTDWVSASSWTNHGGWGNTHADGPGPGWYVPSTPSLCRAPSRFHGLSSLGEDAQGESGDYFSVEEG